MQPARGLQRMTARPTLDRYVPDAACELLDAQRGTQNPEQSSWKRRPARDRLTALVPSPSCRASINAVEAGQAHVIWRCQEQEPAWPKNSREFRDSLTWTVHVLHGLTGDHNV